MPQFIQQLINDVQHMEEQYKSAKAGELFDFYEVVKPFTDKVDQHVAVLKSHEPDILVLPYMNKMKFNILVSNIEELSVECHFKRTSRKLFTEKLKAVHYDLSYIQDNGVNL